MGGGGGVKCLLAGSVWRCQHEFCEDKKLRIAIGPDHSSSPEFLCISTSTVFLHLNGVLNFMFHKQSNLANISSQRAIKEQVDPINVLQSQVQSVLT